MTVNGISFFLSPGLPSAAFTAGFKGSAAALRWIRNQPTRQRNCGNSWESPWGRGYLQDDFLSVWFRDAQGCLSFPPCHHRLGLSGKFVSLYQIGLNTSNGASKLWSPHCLSGRLGPHMNMHIHKQEFSFMPPTKKTPPYPYAFIFL